MGGVAGILATGVQSGSASDLADGRTAAPWLGWWVGSGDFSGGVVSAVDYWGMGAAEV